MGGHRLLPRPGELIDRSRAISFTFAGQRMSGYAGDTLASALLANGVRTVARSFKLHRRRGVFACGPEEPSAIVDVGAGARRLAATRVTDIALFEGLSADSAHARPGLEFDVAAINGAFRSLLPAGFYYKTFKWPAWHLFEPTIRRMAGLGRAPSGPDPDRYDEVAASIDVLVVGGGAAGIAAARVAAQRGASSLLLTSGARLGGRARWAGPTAEALPEHVEADLRRAGCRVLTRTTAVAGYDDRLVIAVETLQTPAEDPRPPRERLWKIRARKIVLATGALERPLLFPDNDRPGVMLASATLRYASEYSVSCGNNVLLAAGADDGFTVAERLRALGVRVVGIADLRNGSGQGEPATDLPVWRSSQIQPVSGRDGVRRVSIEHAAGRLVVDADVIACAGGPIPNVALAAQLGAGLQWIEQAAAFVPSALPGDVVCTGACAGTFDVNVVPLHAGAAASALIDGRPLPQAPVVGHGVVLADSATTARGRPVFVDLANDVTRDDIALAAREGYRSVEHLKRYTTTGMGSDQGKSANVNALVTLGKETGRAPAEVGTTRFRPPYKPVTLGAIAGGRTGDRLLPRKRLPAHHWHEAHGAEFDEYGNWLRPSAYPRPGESLDAACRREALAVRNAVGLFDASPLGKLEIVGPDAADFLDHMYVGTLSTLAVGRARYGLLTGESGSVLDDGIVARLGERHFWVNASSAGADRVAAIFEEWLQCEHVGMRVAVIPVTGQWATVTVSGPCAWSLLKSAGLPDSVAPTRFRHLSMACLSVAGTPIRILRASYTGEASYELSVPRSQATDWFECLEAAGRPLGVVPYGVDALDTLRIEKGFIHVGADTDGNTIPDDIGFGRAVAAKRANFVGRRSLSTPAALAQDRHQLVGLEAIEPSAILPSGAHVLTVDAHPVSDGWVTSSRYSPTLGRGVALAMLRGGRRRIGDRVRLVHLGGHWGARVVPATAYDPDGARLDVA